MSCSYCLALIRFSRISPDFQTYIYNLSKVNKLEVDNGWICNFVQTLVFRNSSLGTQVVNNHIYALNNYTQRGLNIPMFGDGVELFIYLQIHLQAQSANNLMKKLTLCVNVQSGEKSMGSVILHH